MAEKKYVVPQGMLDAALAAACEVNSGSLARVEAGLIAAVKWLSENPIKPTKEQIDQMMHGMQGLENLGRFAVEQGSVEWQKRMFLVPQPEIRRFVRNMITRGCTFTPEEAEFMIDEIAYSTHGEIPNYARKEKP